MKKIIALGMSVLFMVSIVIVLRVPQKERYFAKMSFQELIDKGYKQEMLDEIVQQLITTKTFVNDELKIKDMQIIEDYETFQELQSVSFVIKFEKENVEYEIEYSINNENALYKLNIGCLQERSINEFLSIPIDQKFTNNIGHYIHIDNAYNIINEKRHHMTWNQKTGNYSYVENGPMNIHLYEYQDTLYNFYCSISKSF